MDRTLFFIVNGNSKIGFGHIKRCLMFAQEAQKLVTNGIFLLEQENKQVIDILKKENVPYKITKNKEEIISVLRNYTNPYVIIDSDKLEYRDLEFQQSLIKNDVKFLHITVDNKTKFLSHFILNQNIIGESLSYDTANYTQKLLGPKYFILDKKARQIKPKPPLQKKASYTILISFGRADPLNLTEKTLECLQVIHSEINKAYVIVGPLNNRLEEIKQLSNRIKIPIEVVYNTNNMYDFMNKSDVAFTSMGLTFWELNLHNIPCICTSGSIREEKVLEFIADKEFCISLGNGRVYHKEKWQSKIQEIFKNNEFLTLRNEQLRKTINQKGINIVLEKFLNEA